MYLIGKRLQISTRVTMIKSNGIEQYMNYTCMYYAIGTLVQYITTKTVFVRLLISFLITRLEPM